MIVQRRCIRIASHEAGKAVLIILRDHEVYRRRCLLDESRERAGARSYHDFAGQGRQVLGRYIASTHVQSDPSDKQYFREVEQLATFGSDREGENTFSTAVRQRQVDLLERHRYELHL